VLPHWKVADERGSFVIHGSLHSFSTGTPFSMPLADPIFGPMSDAIEYLFAASFYATT
jgi:hypothetical protein